MTETSRLSLLARLGLALAVLVVALSGGCAGPGGAKTDAPDHHLERGFRNLNPEFRRPTGWARFRFALARIWSSAASPRSADLPRAANDGDALRRNHGDATVTWLGHATVLIQIDGVNVLTDPQWSLRASPMPFLGPRRVIPPGIRFENLPPIHVVLISHDHYDHLDVATVTRLWQAHRPLFVAPLGYRAWFASLGITNVEELDWWESRAVLGLTLTSVPAQHWTSRTPWDRMRRLWSGWAVAGRSRRFLFTGDTGYYQPMFTEVGRRLGPFDLAAISIGAYMPRQIMAMTHTTPEEAVQLFEDVRARRLMAIHWGTFHLGEEPAAEPPRRLRAEAQRRGLGPDRVWLLRHGETRRW